MRCGLALAVSLMSTGVAATERPVQVASAHCHAGAHSHVHIAPRIYVGHAHSGGRLRPLELSPGDRHVVGAALALGGIAASALGGVALACGSNELGCKLTTD